MSSTQSNPTIIYEDGYLLVLDKPPFWIVNRAQTTQGKETVQDWLEANFDFETVKLGNLRAGIAHRLDKNTSGLLLVGKTKASLAILQEQFFSRQVKKEYLALVHDIITQDGGINVPISRLARDRERFGVNPDGKAAQTDFIREAIYQRPKSGEKFSLIRAFPYTGRTHQIRVHLRYLGHPLVSDPDYVGRKRYRLDQEWCPRIFLHATSITLSHPNSQGKVSFLSPLPTDLLIALAKLEREK
jgi:23S rRNA pseudouridine1911/1915/1917 synthase